MIDTSLMKELLTEELQTLTVELSALGITNPQNAEDWIAIPQDTDSFEPDENVTADKAEDWEERNATISALEISYRNLLRALQKIETSEYGICEIDGEKIEEDRLAVEPSARTCKEHMDEEMDLSV